VASSYTLVLASILLLYLFPLYVDTGVNAIYARKTTISSRINSLVLLNKVLPKVPTNTSGKPLEPEVLRLVASQPSSDSSSKSVFGDRVRPHWHDVTGAAI
jgi:hypothetical protein